MVDSLTSSNESREAAEASECANEQERFWDYHDALFANSSEVPGTFSAKRLKAIAELVGLDLNQFNACFDSNKYADVVQQDIALAQSLGVSGTPTIFVNGNVLSSQLAFNPANYAQYLVPGSVPLTPAATP